MARKKKPSPPDGVNGKETEPTPLISNPSPQAASPSTPQAAVDPWTKPGSGALIICRNKHWRYISSFHGPWLQLPPEVLESLAHSNYLSPCPHPIDPAVFYDLVKIRRAVDQATDLAVRASSGVTSAALNSSLNGYGGLIAANGAGALGLGYGGTGPSANLSRERKHRMRELASQKLSQAYHLDEIAASVATMQSASTLEDVAQIVLQRNSGDYDARYVHFFHEKIPSRMMAQCTPLDPLDRIIAERPTDGSVWRTRALTRLFKEDWEGAARDLTEALAAVRFQSGQHRAGKDQLVLASAAREEAEKRGLNWSQETKIAEEDQPSSLEPQLLFHRAGVYLTLACQSVDAALNGLKEFEEKRRKIRDENQGVPEGEMPQLSDKELAAHRKRLEARKSVKTNAKRSLRDYTTFLSHFDYTPGLPQEIAEEFIRRVNSAATGLKTPKRSAPPRQITASANEEPQDGVAASSGALISRPWKNGAEQNPHGAGWPSLPPPEVYQVSQLFSPTPPPNLPPYPTTNDNQPNSEASSAANAFAESHEAITYHPLLTDAIHSLLLSHALIQTSPTELLRHAHNAARLARVCDGYPIFLASRSPSRADWVEVLRRANNWIGLKSSWESLCRPAPLPTESKKVAPYRGRDRTSAWEEQRKKSDEVAGIVARMDEDDHSARNLKPEHPSEQSKGKGVNGHSSSYEEAPWEKPADKREWEQQIVRRVEEEKKARRQRELEQKRKEMEAEKRKHEVILEALGDERVVDEDSFRASVKARVERRDADAKEERGAVDKAHSPQRDSIPNGSSETSVPLPPTTAASRCTSASKPLPLRTNAANPADPDTAKHPASDRPSPKDPPSNTPKRWAQEEGKEYPISTERAEAIARWVREAPLTMEGAKKAGAKKKRPGVNRRRAAAAAGKGKGAVAAGGRVEELGADEDELE